MYTHAYRYTRTSALHVISLLSLCLLLSEVLNDDDDDVYLKKITTRMSQNLILHKNADQPKA